MPIKISHPSKTFLVGEYAVTNGGDALLAATSPRFSLEIEDCEPTAPLNLHKDSPIYKLMQDHKQALRGKTLTFHDPHSGRGGFGHSSAQFLSVYHYLYMNKNNDIDIQACLSLYESYSRTNTGVQPSGADLIAQYCGGLTHFNKKTTTFKNSTWNFPSLELFILATGTKVATHNHLAKLHIPPSKLLQSLSKDAILAHDEGDQEAWIDSIKRFHDQLTMEGLCADHTKALIAQLYREPSVLACKGCGALGADVIMVLAKKQNRRKVVERCEQLQLGIIADSSSFSEGVRVIYA